ncbi:GrxC Glutaredoxin and related proteins [uncultured Caudovirales phage]|uniref:GrxC Glutaredoxin and related proteins n=1 Tax=uncultured Caudovirales phage TaxID=2100421 RepID=A0A6J5KTY3_9CAUD|nr:GrxC Glutaredoxin and related proteins [uncultured Caudovirales phage]
MTITIYSNPNCVQCEQTKKFLTRKGVPFESKMISESPEVQAIIDEHKFQSAPVVVISTGQVWSGFRLDHLTDYVHKYNAEVKS